MSRKIIRNIIFCARCDGNHKELEIRPFSNPPDDKFDHFAICPATGEPILVAIEKTEQEKTHDDN